MSRASWKDFRIDPLRGDEIPNKDQNAEKKFKKPSKKQYLRWLVNFKNALQALGLSWMIPMAMALPFSDGAFDQLIDVRIPDEHDSVFFQLKVVERAIAAGALMEIPMFDDWDVGENLTDNFRWVIKQIAMFNAQASWRLSTPFQRSTLA